MRYLGEAREEFLHEVRYFSAVSARLGEQFDKAVQKAETRAAAHPEMGSPYRRGTRRVLTGKFKFSLVYLTRPDEIVIVAMAAFGRRPGYWRHRLGGDR
ncbi:MAG: type II toxin-antitoxin system RelE/ParE family toxin [Ottowia sp.]|uniref:type II toxin-antitoxin system RelE/ParE family toxin n=1 Tax=Ottowia sp. TaxID=1898956 RepID=UPI0039E45497